MIGRYEPISLVFVAALLSGGSACNQTPATPTQSITLQLSPNPVVATSQPISGTVDGRHGEFPGSRVAWTTKLTTRGNATLSRVSYRFVETETGRLLHSGGQDGATLGVLIPGPAPMLRSGVESSFPYNFALSGARTPGLTYVLSVTVEITDAAGAQSATSSVAVFF